ncbi:MAG: hypothetical protein R3E01_24150 [Pirellulaceae bacterium]|nr:hypothetical protein [Planctomycetales bacterium]
MFAPADKSDKSLDDRMQVVLAVGKECERFSRSPALVIAIAACSILVLGCHGRFGQHAPGSMASHPMSLWHGLSELFPGANIPVVAVPEEGATGHVWVEQPGYMEYEGDQQLMGGPYGIEPLAPGADATAIQNPLFVPNADWDLVWHQVVDTVDDYFEIEREKPVQIVGGVPTEGRLDTYPQIGATTWEPWRRDSTRGFETWHATLQSIRRQCVVRVIPVTGGSQIHVSVEKELEDVDHPDFATPGSSFPRHDSSLNRTAKQLVELPPQTIGWIPLGHDFALEQEIISHLRARLFEP